jgi:hypothetical protein
MGLAIDILRIVFYVAAIGCFTYSIVAIRQARRHDKQLAALRERTVRDLDGALASMARIRQLRQDRPEAN